eukprot:7325835-Alexandrium_andersonii.AAC.1
MDICAACEHLQVARVAFAGIGLTGLLPGPNSSDYLAKLADFAGCATQASGELRKLPECCAGVQN